MAGKLLKDTKDIENEKLNKNSKIEEDNIYKIDIDTNDADIKKIPDNEEEIDEIFGNVNKWLKDSEKEIAEKKSK